jgi:hypothetical protein
MDLEGQADERLSRLARDEHAVRSSWSERRQFRDAKISRCADCWDLTTYMKQVGLLK